VPSHIVTRDRKRSRNILKPTIRSASITSLSPSGVTDRTREAAIHGMNVG
jgi:hypothetical protein